MTTAPPDKAQTGYIPSLDGLRACAVMLVVVAHAGYGHVVPGGLGVTIFFFLSGYLITTLFYRERDKTARIDLPAFYMRRILRLSPPLLISLLIGYGMLMMGLAEGGVELGNLLSQVLYFANYYQLYGGPDQQLVDGQWVLWSLAVEEHFYMLYPLFFIFLSTRESTAARARLMGTFLLLTVLWRVVVSLWTTLPQDHLYYATDARLDSIMYGCLLAVMVQEGVTERLFPKRANALWAYTTAALAIMLFTLLYRDELFRYTLRYSLQGIALMPLFYYAVYMPDVPHHRLLNWRPIKAVGVYSYSIYLSHDVIMSALTSPFGMEQPWLRLLLGSALSIGYGAAIFYLVDQPMLRLRRKLHTPTPARASTA